MAFGSDKQRKAAFAKRRTQPKPRRAALGKAPREPILVAPRFRILPAADAATYRVEERGPDGAFLWPNEYESPGAARLHIGLVVALDPNPFHSLRSLSV